MFFSFFTHTNRAPKSMSTETGTWHVHTAKHVLSCLCHRLNKSTLSPVEILDTSAHVIVQCTQPCNHHPRSSDQTGNDAHARDQAHRLLCHPLHTPCTKGAGFSSAAAASSLAVAARSGPAARRALLPARAAALPQFRAQRTSAPQQRCALRRSRPRHRLPSCLCACARACAFVCVFPCMHSAGGPKSQPDSACTPPLNGQACCMPHASTHTHYTPHAHMHTQSHTQSLSLSHTHPPTPTHIAGRPAHLSCPAMT